MTATAAAIGFSSTFSIMTSGSYVAVGEVTSITPPGLTRGAIDATHLGSPDGYKEFIAEIAEAGEASITLNLVPSATDVLITAFNAGVGDFEIEFPSGVSMTFDGVITSYELGDLTLDKMTATLTVKASGKPAMVAA
jgi:hypothetical protein